MVGDGLASLFLQADEVHHSMWGLVFHELKSFFESRTHTHTSYRDLAATMNLMFDNTEKEDSGDSSDPGPATEQATVQPPWIVAAFAAEEGAHSHSDLLTLEERAFAARVIEGEHHVKTAGVENPMWGDRQKPVPLDEPILFTFEDYYRNARAKPSAAPARLTRHIRQLSNVYRKSFPRARAKLLSRCGAAGRAQADATHKDVSFVALIKGVPAAKDWTHEGELYAISQLHRFGLPYGSELGVADSFPNNCCKCGGHVVPPGLVDTMPDACKLKLWGDHSSRCAGPANHKAHRELNILVVKGVLTAPEAGPLFREDEIRVETRNHRPHDETAPAEFDHSDLPHPGQLVLGDTACDSAVCDTYLDGSARSVAYAAAQEERNKFKRNEDSSLDVRQKGDRLIPLLVMSEHGAMGAHLKAYLEELATLAVNKPGGVQSMRGTFAVSKYVAKAMLVRRWTARIVWGMQRPSCCTDFGDLTCKCVS